MAEKTFAEGVDELKRMVGTGTLEGRISVNQVYAHWIDDGVSSRGIPASAFNHPRGGEAHYLSGQMTERRDEMISGWARQLLAGGMSENFVRDMQSIADQVFIRAPREFEILRNSTSLKLLDRGVLRFFQPAMVPRLSEEQLKALRGVSGGSVTPSLKLLRSMR